MKKCIKYSVLVWLVLSVQLYAGPADANAEFKRIVESLVALNDLAYSYSVNIQFPNGYKDHLKGEMFIDKENKFLFNDCDAFTMIYTGHWYYYADHRKKVIRIVDLDKDYSKALKDATEKSVFRSNVLVTPGDSALMKAMKIKSYKQEGDLEKIELGFSGGHAMEKVLFCYDRKNNMPVSYEVTVAKPFERTANKTTTAKEITRCTNFRIIKGKSIYDESNYFSFENGRLQLKKYKDYKLSRKT